MHVVIQLCFNLATGKRTHRDVVVLDDNHDEVTDSELPTQLLLPRRLPQEWLPAAMRTGKSGPVRRWVKEPEYLFEDPEGLLEPPALHEVRSVVDETFHPSERDR